MGVDGQTAEDYAVDLEGNLQSLLDRAKSGTYKAPPVRRAYIPKAGSPGETRPLGIPTFEDKVLQRAVVMVLEPLYEQDFLDCSYGFRPGRSAHQALDALWHKTMAMGGGWILDVDIRKFFDTIDHGHLRAFLKRRVRDGVLLRLIGKWLNAGVLEDGCITHPETGNPQGGVISPMLSNLFLHYVLDEWFEQEVRPRLKGQSFLIRYADDFVMGFSHEEDARRVLAVLPKRFAKYGLTIHPDKTRLVPFERPDRGPKQPDTNRREPPGTFDLLGFTHFWSRSLRGNWVVKRKTSDESIQPGAEVAIPVVSVQPTSTDGGSAPHTVPEAEGSLCLLRNHRQLGCSVSIPMVCDRYLEEMALAASPQGDHSLGSILPDAGTISAPATDCDPLSVPSRSELMT